MILFSNMFGNKRMNMASPCPDDLVKLQSEFVFQLQQGVVLLRHHLKFFDTGRMHGPSRRER